MVQVLCDSHARNGRKQYCTMTSKKRRRHTPDQIIRKLAEGHKQLAAGKNLDEVCRHLEIAVSTWHRWRATHAPPHVHHCRARRRVPLRDAQAAASRAEGRTQNVHPGECRKRGASMRRAPRTGDRLGRHPAPKCLTEARRETFGINRSGAGDAPASEADGEVLLDRRSGKLQPVECASEFGGLTVVEFPANRANLIPQC